MMKHAVWILVIVLVVLHQDYWQWNDSTLDFDLLPRTLTYHIFISLAAAGVWLLATRHAWPAGLDEDPGEVTEDAES